MTRLALLGTVATTATLYGLATAISIRPVADRDVWWHLRTGEWIVRHGAVPHADPFAVEGAGKAWIASSWLFDVVLYGLHRRFGAAGLAAYGLVVGLACLMALQWLTTRTSRRPITAIALPALALAIVAPVVGPRPALASVLFYAIELGVLFSVLENGPRRQLWLLPPLFVVWANVDRGFGHGLLVLALATVALQWERRRRPDRASEGAAPELARVTLVCGLAALLTPYHLGLFSMVLDVGAYAAGRESLGDVMSPVFRDASDWIMLALLLGGAFAAGGRSPHRTFMVLLLLASAFAAFRANRDAWLVAVSAAAILSSPQVRRPWGRSPERWLFPARSPGVGAAPVHRGDAVARRGVIVTVVVTASVVALVASWSAPQEPRWRGQVSARFPVAAAQVVEDRGYPGPLFSPLEWGGYLLWRLPRLATTVDPRLDVHGAARIRQVMATWDGGREWALDPDLARAGTVVAPSDSSLTTLLHGDPRFMLVYTDGVAALFVARRAAHGSGQ
jgi:hypothetical protein